MGYVFRKKTDAIERVTILRFEKENGKQEMTFARSYGFCDMIFDSMNEGLPSIWGEPRKRTGDENVELGVGHMLRLPKETDKEPLAVTNIYPDHTGANWMNHGLIVSNEQYVFLFVHTSNKILSPESIVDVYFSSDLRGWPDRTDESE